MPLHAILPTRLPARSVVAGLFGLVALVAADTPRLAAQSQYTYTIVADLANSSAFEPSINASGQVAFVSYTGLVQRWDNGLLTTLYAVTPGEYGPSGPVSINASGAVAFHGYSFVRGSAILVADAPGSVTGIADSAAGPWVPINSPAINDQGLVVFPAMNGSNNTYAVMTGNFVPVASPGDAVPGGTIVGAGSPALNNAGQLVFSAYTSDLTTKVFRTSFPAPGSVALMGNAPSTAVASYAMNDAGTVAYWTTASGYASILMSDGITTSTVFAGSAGATPQPYRVAINNSGHVAFMTQDDTSGGQRILVSDGTNVRQVISTGDTIPGLGVVMDMYIYNEAINDAGQVAFLARFDGGARQAILRADPANMAPIAADQAVSATEDTAVNGQLAATDVNGDSLTFSIASAGTLGTATITDATTGAFTYTPNPNANGLDTFTFSAHDGVIASNVATATVTIQPVNDPPVATNANVAVAAGSSASGVLNATDVDSPALTYAIVTNGSSGVATVTDASTGAFTYLANAGTSGGDTFTFVANDGSADSNTATIGVTITPVPLSVAVVAPNGGERVFIKVPTAVRWTSTLLPSSYDVELSRNGGTTFAPIRECTGLPATAVSCAWTPTAPASTSARIRVIARAPSGSVADASDANFTISKPDRR